MVIHCFRAYYSAGIVAGEREALKKTCSRYALSCSISISPKPTPAAGHATNHRTGKVSSERSSQAKPKQGFFQSAGHWAGGSTMNRHLTAWHKEDKIYILILKKDQ